MLGRAAFLRRPPAETQALGCRSAKLNRGQRRRGSRGGRADDRAGLVGRRVGGGFRPGQRGGRDQLGRSPDRRCGPRKDPRPPEPPRKRSGSAARQCWAGTRVALVVRSGREAGIATQAPPYHRNRAPPRRRRGRPLLGDRPTMSPTGPIGTPQNHAPATPPQLRDESGLECAPMEIKRITAASVIDVIEAIATFASDQRSGQADLVPRRALLHAPLATGDCSGRCYRPGVLLRLRSALDHDVPPAQPALLARRLPADRLGTHVFNATHGVKTRLVIWSENAFVGLWFALDGACNAKPAHDDCNPVLWLLDPQELNRVSLAHVHEDSSLVPILTTADEDIKPYAPETVSPSPRRIKSAVAVYGTHNSARISAQRGVFTVAGKDLAAIEDSVEACTRIWQAYPCRHRPQGRRRCVQGRTQSPWVHDIHHYPVPPGLARDLDAHMSRK